jgi:hypothetical protein
MELEEQAKIEEEKSKHQSGHRIEVKQSADG